MKPLKGNQITCNAYQPMSRFIKLLATVDITTKVIFQVETVIWFNRKFEVVVVYNNQNSSLNLPKRYLKVEFY